jgi:exonuclease III
MSEYTYKIATLNINGIAATTRIQMLEDFLHTHDIDIACLQEMTNTAINTKRNYTSHMNIGSDDRGTAIPTKDCYQLTDIRRIPTGRGMSAHFNGVKILNVYAPSGSEKRHDREDFYNFVSVPFTYTS